MTKEQERQKAIEAYKAISEGKVQGVKINKINVIKGGSITFTL